MHVAREDSVLDQNGILCKLAFVIQIDRKRGFAVGSRVCVINHGDKIGSHPLVQIRTCNRSAHHQIGLDGVSNGLVGKHAGERSAQDHGLVSGLSVDAVDLVHELAVQPVDTWEHPFDAAEIGLEVSGSAENTEELQGSVVLLGQCRHHDIHVAARVGDVSVICIRGIEDLVLGVLGIDHRPAGQVWISLHDVIIHGLACLDDALLLEVDYTLVDRDYACSVARMCAESFGCMAVQEFCILGGRLEHGISR